MRVGLVSLGCARTLVDSEVALGSLKVAGHRIVEDVEQAEVAVVNTCGFIEEAKLESIEQILELCQRKKEGKLKAVVVLGCLAQRHGEELRKELGDEVDGILGTDSFASLAQLLEPLEEKNARVYQVRAKPRYLLDEKTPRVSLTPEHTAYLKISEGCINACSYCVIPKIKGVHRSRTVESVIEEARRLSQERALSEINLIGQDTAAFGFDRSRTFELPRLLRELDRLKPAPWIRLLYAHPGHVTEELIDVLADSRSICKYVDLPIEHSHDAVLKAMNRGVDRATMERVIATLRKRIPGVVIRTTVIVGFPGETDEQFRDLMEFLNAVRFERLGAFQFSREEGSRAYELPGQISPKTKKERFDAVMEQQLALSEEFHRGFIGKRLRVLIDGPDPDQKDGYIGRAEFDAPEVDGQVIVTSARPLKAGQFVEATITDALEYDLVGEV